MGVTVTGENLQDVQNKVGYQREDFGVTIKWRRKYEDYRAIDNLGCVIRVGNAIPLEFENATKAIAYLAKTLKAHDAIAKERIAERKKKEKQKAKAE